MSSVSDNVVSRSGLQMPGWARGETSPDTSRWVYGTFAKRQNVKLELGLRQAQAEARINGKGLLLGKARDEFFQYISQHYSGSGQATLRTAVESALAELTPSFAPPHVEQVDSYWEEVRLERDGRTTTHFDIYILVRMERQAYDEAVTGIATILTGRPDEEARSLGMGFQNITSEVAPEGENENVGE